MTKSRSEKKICIIIGTVFLVGVTVCVYCYKKTDSTPRIPYAFSKKEVNKRKVRQGHPPLPAAKSDVLWRDREEEKAGHKESSAHAPGQLSGEDPDKYERLLTLLFAHWELLDSEDERAAEVIEDAIYDEQPDIKEMAMEVSLQLDDPPIDAILDIALSNENDDVRFKAVEILGMMKNNTEAVEALVDCLDDERLGAKAAEELAALGMQSVDAAETIAYALDDPDPAVQIAAIGVLEKIGSSASAMAMLGALEDPEEGVRQRARYALDNMEWDVVREAMEGVLREEDDEVILKFAQEVLEGKCCSYPF